MTSAGESLSVIGLPILRHCGRYWLVSTGDATRLPKDGAYEGGGIVEARVDSRFRETRSRGRRYGETRKRTDRQMHAINRCCPSAILAMVMANSNNNAVNSRTDTRMTLLACCACDYVTALLYVYFIIKINVM